MTANIIDGAALATELLEGVATRCGALRAGGVTPGLAVVMVGNHPASSAYVRNKERACARVGVRSEIHRLPAESSEREILAVVERANRDAGVHGIIVQLPLPRGLPVARILQSVAAEKDVDGFNWRNLGALLDGHAVLAPCTPLGCMHLLERSGVPIAGRHAVVVGRSSIVGKPAALMLLERHATVSICHSRTADLGAITRQADILLCAVGRPGVITAGMVKPGAAVIDVGINRVADGRLTGDVDFQGVREVAGWLTPVPGGVGPMTVAMLVANTVLAAEHAAARHRA